MGAQRFVTVSGVRGVIMRCLACSLSAGLLFGQEASPIAHACRSLPLSLEMVFGVMRDRGKDSFEIQRLAEKRGGGGTSLTLGLVRLLHSASTTRFNCPNYIRSLRHGKSEHKQERFQ